MKLRPFQRTFLANATKPGIETAVLSLPRGNGKSWLAGFLAARLLDPDDRLFQTGTESVLCAASIEQASIVFRFFAATTGTARRVSVSRQCDAGGYHARRHQYAAACPRFQRPKPARISHD